MPLLTTTSAFRLGRRRWTSPQQCYLHYLPTVNLMAYAGREMSTGQRVVKICGLGIKGSIVHSKLVDKRVGSRKNRVITRYHLP